MAQIVKELRVDVSQPNVFQAIVAKQHDSNSRFLKITLVDFGVKVEVPNTAKVTINANRPDGASKSFKGEANNDGTITVPLAQWMLDIDGEVKCDVSVTNTEDNKRLTSTDFWLEVQKAANPNASIPLDPDGEILIIKPVTEINGNSTDDQYPSAKAVFDLDNITATVTGSAITIESANAPLQNLKLYGKTEQDGTPTPTEPKALKSVGNSGSFSLNVYEKNLIGDNRGLIERTHRGVTYTPVFRNDGLLDYILVNGIATGGKSEYWCTTAQSYSIPLPKGSVVTLSGSTEIISIRLQSQDYKHSINSMGTFSTGELLSSVYGCWLQIEEGNTANNVKIRPQLEIGTVATAYEPFNKQSITFAETLRGIGDFKDEKDFTRGIKTEKIYEMVLTGTEAFRVSGNEKGFWLDLTKCLAIQTEVIQTISTHFEGVTSSWIGQPNNTVQVYGKLLKIRYDDCTTIDDFKSFLAKQYANGNPVKVQYVRQAFVETPISETELNDYRQLHTNKPNTTILSEADMEVDYYINKPNAQAIGNIHSQVNADYFKLQQAIISLGGSTL